MDKFAKEWTYRTPMVTTVYPKGHRCQLEPLVQLRARRAGVLVPPATKRKRYGRRLAKAGPSRHTDEA